MGKFLATTLLLFCGGLYLGALDRVTLPIPYSPEILVSAAGLVWNYPGTEGDPGVVDWVGEAPTNLRAPRVVSFDSAPVLLVVGTRYNSEGLYVLNPVWGGATLVGDQAWLEAPVGETIQGYRWMSSNPPTAVLWTKNTLLGRTDHALGPLVGEQRRSEGSQSVVSLLSWTEGATAGWAFVELTETPEGWFPAISTFAEGRWSTRATGQAVALSGTGLPELSVTHPVDGQFSVSASRGSAWVQWAWNSSAPKQPLVLNLDAAPKAVAASLPDRPALFWWTEGSRVAGRATSRLETSQLVAWSQPLPGTLLWSSDLMIRSDGWRVWLIVDNPDSTDLYRLDVRDDGWSSLDRAGSLPRGTTSLALQLDSGQWSVRLDASPDPLLLDPEAPRLSEVRNAQ